MISELEFRQHSEPALESLTKLLISAEETSDIEVEDQAGAIHIAFEDGTKFVISPNSAARQIWISALATSFKLDWSDGRENFLLSKTGENLPTLVTRLLNQQLGEEIVNLS